MLLVRQVSCRLGGVAERGSIIGVNRNGILQCIPKETIIPCAGVKDLIAPQKLDWVEYPERRKLKFQEKVPQYPAGLRPPKMFKNLYFMRGPELVHNTLIHRQYGIVARSPGRMKFGHFEMLRLTIGRKLDQDRMFAVWRVDAPWQSVTKKSQGQRMGGGKASIDHYVTPIKHGRIIIEVGGNLEKEEAFSVMKEVSEKLPFKAEMVTHEMLQHEAAKKLQKENANTNPYTFKYLIQNNLGVTHNWVSPFDRKWYGEHL